MAPTSPGAFVLVMNALRPESGRCHGLPGRDVLALLVVADRVGAADGKCFASLTRLAATAGMSRATMQRAIASLVGAGWLVRKRQHRDLTDILTLGPKVKRSHGETSQPEMSHPVPVTCQVDAAERSHVETQSTPVSTPFKHSGKRSNGSPDAGAAVSSPVNAVRAVGEALTRTRPRGERRERERTERKASFNPLSATTGERLAYVGGAIAILSAASTVSPVPFDVPEGGPEADGPFADRDEDGGDPVSETLLPIFGAGVLGKSVPPSVTPSVLSEAYAIREPWPWGRKRAWNP